ncbi:MAG: tRNA lysidine(34) synthetase TilS [Gammaproteobacteria bacterium]|nr:tRNA lysidine(34) synthetase TilS [Gammaproteobacteria bacterium]
MNAIIHSLQQHLPQNINRFVVAFSGGMDSHVLLHSMVQLRASNPEIILHAVHVDHGLQAKSREWSEHCRLVCEKLDVTCELLKADARAKSGESPEAAARDARYQVLLEAMHANDCLLTAHHQDDQAETLLLQLLRGGGPRGLSSMPMCNAFGVGQHCRPLLGFTREQLLAVAQQAQFEWIEDESNFDTGFDRNYLRHEILPKLKARWPAMAQTMARVASHSAEAADLLDVLAEMDLPVVHDGEGLSIQRLLRFDDARKRNILRFWLRQQHRPLPDTRQMEHILVDVLQAGEDRNPCVAWPGAEIRRYRDHLYVISPSPVLALETALGWDMKSPLQLPGGTGILHAIETTGRGLKQSLCLSRLVNVQFRQGGERLKLAGRDHTHDLKKLFQEKGVPPWERDRIPFVYLGEDLAEVVGYWVGEGFSALDGEKGLQIEWKK